MNRQMRNKRMMGSLLALALLSSGTANANESGVTYQQLTDALHAVMDADRTVYTKTVVNRLQNEDKVIEASEHWKDDKALPLPAQMFRMSAEMVTQKKAGFSYSLLSSWPVNKQNLPKTAGEKAGLAAIEKTPDKPFYTEEKLGNETYFTAVYADRASSRACVECHNKHRDSPKSDFKLNDTMGGVVIRVPKK